MPASGQGGRNLMAFQGILCFIPPCFACGSRSPPSPASIFWPGIFCTQNFVCKAWAESPPMGGDLSAGRRVLVPHACGRWRMKHPSPPNPANQTTGATRAEGRGRSTRRGKRSAHANGGRTTAHARRPRTQPRRGPRPQLSRPASGRTGAQLFFAPLTEIDRIAARQRHGEKRGVVRGEKNTAGAAAKNAPAELTPDQTPEQPPATAPGGAPRARKRTGSRTTARRGDAKQSAASGQAAQADDGETASGRGSRPHPAPRHSTARTTPADGETAARRTATAQAGRTGRESQAAAPPPAQKNAGTERHSTRATDAEAANHGGHGRQHARTPGGGTLRERADGQRAESATGQRQEGGRARESPDKAAEGSGRSGGVPTAQPNAESSANAESRPPDRGPPLRPL